MSKVVKNHMQKIFLSSCFPNCKTVHSISGNTLIKNPNNVYKPYFQSFVRFYSTKKDITVHKEKPNQEISTDVKTVIKETTKTASYSAVILIGIGVTAALFYTVFKELFSSKSPSGVYSQAFQKCSNDPRVTDSLGEPIKGHGEETSRGRRRHVSHLNYVKDGVPHIRMVFYLKGSRKNGTVHLEMKEWSTDMRNNLLPNWLDYSKFPFLIKRNMAAFDANPSGNLEYRYLFVQLDDLSRRVIILEDNRAVEEASKSFKTPLDEFNAPLNLDSH